MARSAIAAQREFGQQHFCPGGVGIGLISPRTIFTRLPVFNLWRSAFMMRRTPLTDRVVRMPPAGNPF
jgi:hypothetical protein